MDSILCRMCGPYSILSLFVTCSLIAKTEPCPEGKYGTGCFNTCIQCQTCEVEAGNCTSCKIGRFGLNCENTCPNSCLNKQCDLRTGICSNCTNGYHGEQCNNRCADNCQDTSCDRKSGKCYNCTNGYYGGQCNNKCPDRCVNSSCDRDSGSCYNCTGGYYGEQCNNKCPDSCQDSSCDKSSGKCYNCKNGYFGEHCKQECQKVCAGSSCHRDSGRCFNCTNGYFGEHCNQECPRYCADLSCHRDSGRCYMCTDGYFGEQCHEKCPDTCADSSCDKDSGKCIMCITGICGYYCNNTCSSKCLDKACNMKNCVCYNCTSGVYGLFCDQKCPSKCKTSICNLQDGSCINGCIANFTGSKCELCQPGNYGKNCDLSCPPNCFNGECRILDGTCTRGDTEQAAGSPTTRVIGIGIGFGILLALVVGTVVICTKRRSSPCKRNEFQPTINPSDEATEADLAGVFESILTIDGNDIDNDDAFVPETNPVQETNENTYYNDVNTNFKLRTEKLYRYMSKSDENYQQEFRMLPVGLIKPCKDAHLPKNTRRNRYKMVYPYDDSRVKVSGEKSDYINASYIDGYKKKNAYIACLGPTEDTLGDFSLFWEMIWQEKVETIVMLTKLKEVSGMKCEQYWPNYGKTVRYGQVNVRNTGEEEYAEFVVRNMTLSMDNEERQFHHIHFTAWPDKGVPSDVISIINLRNKVTKMRRKFESPLVVHCSAGIGRTGTYIALDILIRHGLAEQSVDVLGCIMNMRQQRVHMVQSVEQYKYLHHALLWSLSIDTEPMSVDRFNDLSWVYNGECLDKMLRHLQMENWYDTVEEKSAVEANTKIPFVNRKHSDIPGRRHAVKMLPRDRNKSTEYINAVFIDGYRRQNRFIAAQTPLPETVPTFLDMVVQRQVICIIDLEPNTNQDDVGDYLPDDNDELQSGNFVFRSCNKKDDGAYVKRELELVMDNQKQDKRIITHYQFTKWPRLEIIPDSLQFIKLIHEVKKLVIQTDHSGPILVHCMNGAERSALFCAMWLLIEKLGADNSVSVLNTLRQVKSRRRTAFPNKEQIDFCFNGIVTHLNQLKLNVYSNT